MMDPTDQEIWNEAVDIANRIERLLDGRNSAACFVALGMVIGEAAAAGEKPDFFGFTRAISNVAWTVYQSALARNGSR